jgi:adenylate cyclase class IV
MKIEYEATFVNINKDLIREKLSKIGARLKKAEVKMRRTSFFPPEKFDKNSAYLRVRDEGSDYITMALKVQEKGSGIETERESEIEIKSYEKGVQFFKDLGYEQKSEQESLRET